MFGYGPAVYHTISTSLTGVTGSNPATSIVDGGAYSNTITPNSGYTIDTVSVTMGGSDITSTAYDNGVITIPAVTGNVSITVTASKPQVNRLPLALDTDKESIYPTVSHSSLSTVGYAEGYRLGSAGTESASASNFVTGFIPMTKGQTMTLSGIELPATNYTGYNTCYIAVYDSNLNCIKSYYSKDWHGNGNNPSTADANNHLTSITINEGFSHEDFSQMAYVRFSALSITAQSAVYVE